MDYCFIYIYIPQTIVYIYTSNYLYLKDMYITLKGIGKILFVLVLRIANPSVNL